MEDSVTSTLNLFDIVVRLVPGTAMLYVLAAAYLASVSEFEPSVPIGEMGDTVLIFAVFVGTYIIGTLVRVPAQLLSWIVYRIVYGGNPRDRWLDSSHKRRYMPECLRFLIGRVVFRDEDTRRLARSCYSAIRKKCRFKNNNPRFAFGFMINYLEANGHSAKEDRMCSLSDMASSMAVVLLVALFVVEAAWIKVACAVSALLFIGIFVRYGEIRFKTVVRTFAIDYLFSDERRS